MDVRPSIKRYTFILYKCLQPSHLDVGSVSIVVSPNLTAKETLSFAVGSIEVAWEIMKDTKSHIVQLAGTVELLAY